MEEKRAGDKNLVNFIIPKKFGQPVREYVSPLQKPIGGDSKITDDPMGELNDDDEQEMKEVNGFRRRTIVRGGGYSAKRGRFYRNNNERRNYNNDTEKIQVLTERARESHLSKYFLSNFL